MNEILFEILCVIVWILFIFFIMSIGAMLGYFYRIGQEQKENKE